MRIVITGASGNVGTALLRRLTESGIDHEVVGVVRRPPASADVYSRVRWHGLDLADPRVAPELRKVFEGADAVVHLAWGFQPTRNIDYLHQTGVGGTSAVLEAVHAAGVGQLVHMSSVGAYAAGGYGRRVDESWPATGIPSSPYSRDKAQAEALLDVYERQHGTSGLKIARMRPGFIVQRVAASGLMRYALPGYLPMLAVPLLPLLPLDRRLSIPLIHADDVADAILRIVEGAASGAFNLAAEPPVTRDDVAKVLRAKAFHVPSALLGVLVDLSWRARLQPIDRGWLDMAFSVPLLDTSRAKQMLGWHATWSSVDALADVISGVAQEAHTESPPLRRRSMLEQLQRDLTEGLLTTRRLP